MYTNTSTIPPSSVGNNPGNSSFYLREDTRDLLIVSVMCLVVGLLYKAYNHCRRAMQLTQAGTTPRSFLTTIPAGTAVDVTSLREIIPLAPPSYNTTVALGSTTTRTGNAEPPPPYNAAVTRDNNWLSASGTAESTANEPSSPDREQSFEQDSRSSSRITPEDLSGDLSLSSVNQVGNAASPAQF